MERVRYLLSRLHRLLASRGRTPDEIDDLMQEAFLRLQLYCRDSTVRNTEAFLVRTALNLSVEERRRRARAEKMQVCEEADILSVIDSSPNPDEVYAARQRLLKVEAALQRLTARSREAFLMHRVEGLSYVQIAGQLGISVSMVEKHIARASFFLRDCTARGME